MYVSSYLELYTTLIGWKLYDLSYAVLSELGITLIPFVILIITKMTANNSAQGDNSGISEEVDTVVTMIIAIIIWIGAVIPWATITPSTIQFQPTATFGNLTPTLTNATLEPTTYAGSFNTVDLGNAEIPLWWGFVGQVSTGTAHAITGNLSLEPSLEAMAVNLSHHNINDPDTRAQYKEFYAKCYTPAINKYHRLAAQDKLPGAAVTALNTFGPEDLDWPGSRVLRATPGLYARCDTPDTCGSSLASRQPVEGQPELSCVDWWNSLSLRMQTEDAANSSMWEDFAAYTGLSAEAIEDTRIKNLMANLQTDDIATPNQYGNPGWVSRRLSDIQNLVSIGPIAKRAVGQETEKEVMRQVIPMVKAVALLMLAFILPFLLIVGMYSIGSIITLTIVFFSLYFVHALVGVASWVDHFILTAIAQGYGWTDFLLNPIDLGSGRLLLGIVVGSLYVVAPAIWFYGLMFVGHRAGAAANQLVAGIGAGGANQTVSNAATKSTNYGIDKVKSGWSKIRGK